MEIVNCIFVIICIFVVQTNYSINENHFKLFNELRDRREIASISTTHCFSSTDLFCSDLSSRAQKSNILVMQNKSESLLAQNSIEVHASEKNSKDFVKTLNTTLGFYKRYFHLLPTSKSLNHAFIKVSVEYFNVYQSFKYTNINQFKNEVYGTVN